jgi:hypothetical protein
VVRLTGTMASTCPTLSIRRSWCSGSGGGSGALVASIVVSHPGLPDI